MKINDFKFLFSDFTFEEALEYFENKIPVDKDTYLELTEKYQGQAFTIAGHTEIEVLNQFHQELSKAIEEGSTLSSFREKVNRFLLEKGYEGITAYQADNIFRTNIQTAYQVGHYEQMSDPDVMKLRPYWQYDAVNDGDTRPTHLEMDGKVFRADSPVWDTWYPPNGFRCRCTVTTLSKRQIQKTGLAILDERNVDVLPDVGFDKNPAKREFRPDVSDYPEPLKKAYRGRKEQKNNEAL